MWFVFCLHGHTIFIFDKSLITKNLIMLLFFMLFIYFGIYILLSLKLSYSPLQYSINSSLCTKFLYYFETISLVMSSNNHEENTRQRRWKYPMWRHTLLILGNKNGTICRYYNIVIHSGGITCFKYYLIGSNPKKNIKPCLILPPKVKQ